MLWSQFSEIFANFRRKKLAFFSKTNVMITIFCDFCQFSAKHWRFSQKPMLWSHFLQKLAVVWAKNANIFAKFFGENI
jgi:hypothetical protein